MPPQTYTLAGQRINRYDLYEIAAQMPDMQARFLRAVHAGGPLRLAEDFSGPSAIARAWVALGSAFHAIVTDRDPEPIEHARERLRERHPQAESRFHAINDDVLAARGTVDVIAAFNFALCELHDRKQLVTYLRHVLMRLDALGIFVADLYAGPGAFVPGITEQEIDYEDQVIRYEWEQIEADPINARVRNAMHFVLPGGKRIDNAFTYDWRLWSLAELRDALREAGFRSTEVYLQLAEAITGDGEMLVRPVSTDGSPIDPEDLDPEEDFVAYIVARA